MINNIGFTPTLTFGGNGPNDKLIGSIAEVQLKKILQNELSNYFYFKMSVAAKQLLDLPGLATAIYTRARRNVWGVKYNVNTGATTQTGSGDRAIIQIDKTLNVKFVIEQYDVKTLADPLTAPGLIGEWLGSLTRNLLQNLELILLQGIKDYCIATYKINKSSVMVVDPKSFTTEDKAKEFFINVGYKNNDIIQNIDDTMIGTNLSDLIACFSLNFFTSLTRAYTALVGGNIAAEVLSSGELYKDNVFGMPIQRNFWLDKTYDKSTAQRMNIEASFDLKGMIGVVANNNVWAAPINWQYFSQTMNQDTGNPQWIGKVKLALPTPLYNNLTYIIMDHEPTEDEINASLKRAKLGSLQGGNEFDLETQRYQVADWDPLAEYITNPTKPNLSDTLKTTNLNQLADNQASTIIAAVKSKNVNVPTDIVANDISTTGATITSASANGSVKVSYTVASK